MQRTIFSVVFILLMVMALTIPSYAAGTTTLPNEFLYPLLLLMLGGIVKVFWGAWDKLQELRYKKANGTTAGLDSMLEKVSRMEQMLQTASEYDREVRNDLEQIRDAQTGTNRLLTEILDEMKQSRTFNQQLLNQLVSRLVD